MQSAPSRRPGSRRFRPKRGPAAGGVKTSDLRRARLQTRGIQVYEKGTQLS